MRRRAARESALQILYGVESQGDYSLSRVPELVETFFVHFGNRLATDAEFLEIILKGTFLKLDAFNELISMKSENWKLERMTIVDRNILRIALYEVMYIDEIPCSVTINEAVEVAKRFGTEESGAFINAILDQIRKNLPANPNKAKDDTIDDKSG
jgi:N utilization substance protein B